MKRQIKYYITTLLSILLLSSCVHDEEYTNEKGNNNSEATIYLTVTTPATTLPQSKTRAVNESLISEVQILVFEKLNGTYVYRYKTLGRSVSGAGTNEYQFDALLSTSDNPLKLYMVANSNASITNLEVNDTESTVKSKLQKAFGVNGMESTLPMFGEIELTSGIHEDKQFSGVMVRSLARVDVINKADNFTLTSIRFYRANSAIQVVPDEMNNYMVTNPSIPDNSMSNIKTNPINVVNNKSEAQLYIPESAIPSLADRVLKATCVIVGGRYGTDSEETYYRMDFVPEGQVNLFGQILRNHKYVFTIETVLGPGWRDPDEAAENTSSSLTVEIKEWDENTVHMHFDGENHFGVSHREVTLGYPAGSSHDIDVDTSLSSYLMYWLDSSGNKDDRVKPITLNQSFTDPDGLFTISISQDGTVIKAIANNRNETGNKLTKKLLIQAGRLDIYLTINQDIYKPRRAITILSYRQERGYLGGNFSSANATYGDGLKGILTNKANFGPQGIVDFEGFNLIEDNDAPEDKLQLSNLAGVDVLYIPDMAPASKLSRNSARVILEWLNESPNRILFTNNDDIGRNINILAELGVSVVYSRTSSSRFTICESPFIKGPFGEVTTGDGYLRVDNTYAEIDEVETYYPDITPVLKSVGTVLGVDMKAGIVYAGDVQMFGKFDNAVYGLNNTTGNINNNAATLMANLWAWIAETVLAE